MVILLTIQPLKDNNKGKIREEKSKMKRGKIYLVFVLSLLLMIITSCVKDDHTHQYDKWIIDVNPTETVVGQAHRTCDCGEVEKRKFQF